LFLIFNQCFKMCCHLLVQTQKIILKAALNVLSTGITTFLLRKYYFEKVKTIPLPHIEAKSR